MTIAPEKTTVPRELVSPELFDKLIFRVMADDDADPATSEKVVEQALAFLVACALNPDVA
jgi:hypothetical protein